MNGGDLFLTHQNLFAHSRGELSLFKQNINDGQYSIIWIIIILLNSAISTDPFYLSSSFQSGIIPSFLICIFLYSITVLSFFLFIRTWIYGSVYTYREIWAKCFGKSTKYIPSILILIGYLSITVICEDELYWDFLEIYSSIFKKELNLNKWIIIYSINFIGIFPFLFYKKSSNFRFIALIGKFGMILSILIIIYKSYINFDLEIISKNMILWNKDSSKFFECFGSFNTVFFLHPIINLVVQYLKNPSEDRVISSVNYTSLLVAFFCLLSGYSTYFLILNNEFEENILYYFPKENLLTIIGKIGSFLSNLSLVCFYIWLIAKEFCQLIFDNSDLHNTTRVIGGLVTISFNIAMNFINFEVVNIFGLIGNLCFIILSFILPSSFFLKIYYNSSNFWSKLAIILIIISVPISLINFYFEIISL